jgi:hypothetical protein
LLTSLIPLSRCATASITLSIVNIQIARFFLALTEFLLKLASVATRIRILWKYCFLYGGLVTIISIATKVAFTAFNYTCPMILALLSGGFFHLAIGTWYVHVFARSKAGGRIQLGRAALAILVFVLILALLLGGLFLLVKIARYSMQH